MSTTPLSTTALAEGRTRRRAASVAVWCVQATLAVQLLVAGTLKIVGDPQMIDMFAQIGAGQWFRFAVGALELAGALGLLVPRLAGAAALGIAGLMTGAVLTNVVLLQTNPALPVMFLLLSGLVTAVRRHEIRQLSAIVAAAR